MNEHKLHTGHFNEGDFLVNDTDNKIYSVNSSKIDKNTELEIRLKQERQNTEKDILKINRYFSEKIYDNTVKRHEMEKKLNKLKKALMWVSFIVFGLFVSVGFALNYIFNKL